MNIIDICLIVGIILAALWGLRAGLVASLAGIGVVYVSYYFSNFFTGVIVNSLSFLGDINAAKVPLLALALFIFLYVVGAVILWLLKKVVEIKILGVLDSVGGFIFSGLKFMVFVAALFQIIVLFPLSSNMKGWLNDSYLMDISSTLFKRTYPIAESTIPQVRTYLSETVIPAVKGEKMETSAGTIQKAKQATAKMSAAATTLNATLEAIKKDLGLKDVKVIDVSSIIMKP